jgi:hypothetical protein
VALSPDPFQRFAMRAALAIGIVRIAALWTSMQLMQASDVRQVVGYVLLVVTCLPEMALAGSLRSNVPAWTVVVTCLIALTSMAMGYAVALIARKSQSRWNQ